MDAYQQAIALQGKNLRVEDFHQRYAEGFLVPIALELDELTIVARVPQMARPIMEPAQLAFDLPFPVQEFPLRHRCLHQESEWLRGIGRTTGGWQ